MPAKTTGRLVKVPATTNNITRGIINYLNIRGHYAFRVNTTGIWDPAKQILRRTNSPLGVADIICCLKIKNQAEGKDMTGGQFLAIEVKNKNTRDKPRPEQKQFALDIAQAGGWPLVVTSYGEFVRWYEDQVKKGILV